jgi:hypothetical protein
VALGTRFGQEVVLTVLDALGAEQLVQLVPARILTDPLLDSVEHVTLDLISLIADRGVMEGAKKVIDDLVYGNPGILPGVEDAA